MEFQPYSKYFSVEVLSTYQAGIVIKESAGNAP